MDDNICVDIEQGHKKVEECSCLGQTNMGIGLEWTDWERESLNFRGGRDLIFKFR